MLVDRLESLAKRVAELEGVDAAQAVLELPDLELQAPPAVKPQAPEPPPSKPRKPRRGHGPTPQSKLPVKGIEHRFQEPPDCPACGGEMQLFEGQFETSEEITVLETSFQVLCHRRAKYRCSCHAAVLTAPGPDKLIPGGRYSVDFAVHSAIEKFCDHTPLARQTRRMERAGLQISTQTLFDQQAALARHCEPTWQALWERALSEDVLHVDETGWRMMDSKTRPRWTLFGLTAPRLAVYHLASAKTA